MPKLILVERVDVLSVGQVSMGTIHASFGVFEDVRSQVLANRGGDIAAILEHARCLYGTGCSSSSAALLQSIEAGEDPSTRWWWWGGATDEGRGHDTTRSYYILL